MWNRYQNLSKQPNEFIFHGAKCTFHGAKRNFLPLSFTFIKGFLLFSVHSFDHFFANQPTKATPTANSFSLLYRPSPMRRVV